MTRDPAATANDVRNGTSYETPVDSLRVLVAGGRRLVREGIAALLDIEADVDVVATASEGLAAEAAIERASVDVVVTHVHLGEHGGGARLADHLRTERPDVGVVLLLGDSDPTEVDRVLRDGTQGRALLMMDHPRCRADLPVAVREVAAGGSIVHPDVVDLVLSARGRGAGRLARLTTSEREVLEELAAGASNLAIAERLGLSTRAVEKRIGQLYDKLDLPPDATTHRRVAATLVALDELGRVG